MKKLFFVLACAVLPFAFSSCDKDEAEDVISSVTGKMEITINGQSHSYPGCGSYQKSGKTYIATTGGKNLVAMQLDGTAAKKYVLGVVEDFSLNGLASLIGNGFEVSNFSSYLTFVPFDNKNETYVTVAGSCTVTSATSTDIKGTFSGYAVKVSDLQNGISASLLTNATPVSGTFSAKESSSIASIFSK